MAEQWGVVRVVRGGLAVHATALAVQWDHVRIVWDHVGEQWDALAVDLGIDARRGRVVGVDGGVVPVCDAIVIIRRIVGADASSLRRADARRVAAWATLGR